MELIVRRHSRIDILDAVRGIAILSMVVYHALYDINDVFGYHIWLFDALSVLEPPFAGLFILLSGISCRFSHSNTKRGVRVLVFAMAVTGVTALFSAFVSPGETIWFGILHFLGVAILLYALLHTPLEKIPPVPAFVLWSALFVVTYQMPATGCVGLAGCLQWALPARLFSTAFLFPLGFPDANFTSADYFPLIPWIFLFFAGTVLGKPIREHRLPEKFYTARVPVLAAAGRNTLLIYLLHQPVIYLLLLAIFHLV